MFIRFRDRESLVPGRLEAVEMLHSVAAPEAEVPLRRFAGRFVAVLRTAAANARGNCVAWIAGFETRDAARQALAEAMAERLALYGHRLSAAEVAGLARRSSGCFAPEWGGPERRFERLSLLLHYGRIYIPLDGAEEEADRLAYEAYMAERRAADEAAAEAERARKAALEARAAEVAEAACSAQECMRRHLRLEAERKSREQREDEEAVSQLLWRAYDRQLGESGREQRRHGEALRSVADRLRWAGIRWKEIDTPNGALDLARQEWFRRRCMFDRGMALLRRRLIEESYAVLNASAGAMEAAEDLLPRIRRVVAFLRAVAVAASSRR